MSHGDSDILGDEQLTTRPKTPEQIATECIDQYCEHSNPEIEPELVREFADCLRTYAAAIEKERDGLRRIIEAIHVYSRRYCDGRKSYAVSEHNRATDDAIRLGCKLQVDPIVDSLYAKDGMFDLPATNKEPA